MICKWVRVCFQWPLPPTNGLTICDGCIETKYDVLNLLTTMDARRKYRLKDLSGLLWVPDPYPPHQA
jgi:hypothetical protein